MTAIGRRSGEKVQLERELRGRLERGIKARQRVISGPTDKESERAFSEVDESFRLNFDGSNMRKLKLWHCDFSHGLFRKCYMEGIVFWGCNLSDVNFSDSALSGSIFSDCCLDRAIFSKNNLNGAQLARVSLRDTRFYQGVDVSNTAVFETNLDQVHKTLRPKWNDKWVFNFGPPRKNLWVAGLGGCG
jgi:hypothetical protein